VINSGGEWISSIDLRWQVPERWTVVDDLPRTSVGKIGKGALRAMYVERRLTVRTVNVPRTS
jgi:fatty-acyl-CoA synthase